jgi:hypothetical protein
MKNKKLLISLLSLAIVLTTSTLLYLFIAVKPFSPEDTEITELGSVYISDSNDVAQLQTNIEEEVNIGEEINPSKKGELITDENRKVVNFEKELSEEEIAQIETEYNVKFTDDQSIQGTYSVITTDESKTEELQQDEKVESVETDIPVKMFADTIDWGIVRVGASKVWDSGSGAGIKVGVIDTGVQLDHPDLGINILSGYDFVNNDTSANDDNGHGTHVAGIVASTLNESGNVGASYSANLLPVKVLNESGYGYLSDVAKGIYYATDNGARVINMSLGTTYDSDTLKRAIEYSTNKGVLIVAAAGNESGSPCSYPAAYSSVICVVATDQNNKLASFSNIGGELAAPGVSNYSAYINSSYATLSGTSMASPHVAGSAALLMSLCSDCSTSEIRELLRSTAVDLGAEDYDIIFGYGLVNLINAVDTLAPEEEEPTNEDDEQEEQEDQQENEQEETPTEQPAQEPDYQEENQGEDNEIRNIHQTPPSQPITIKLTSPDINASKRYLVKENEDIELEFTISPEDTSVKSYSIYLNDEEIEDYEGVDTSYTFDIEELENIQYILEIEALLEDENTVSNSFLLDLTHLSRGRSSFSERSVKGVSDIRSWFTQLFVN